jgi:hypothetical protein
VGSSLQRLEVLLIGLVILIAGAVVAMMLFLRPPSPAAYLPITPQPVASTVVALAPSAPAIPTGTSAPSTPAAPEMAGAPETVGARAAAFRIPPIVTARWPWLALLLGMLACGALVMRRVRTRRLPYTNQNIGQLLAASDPITRETTMRVMQDLAERGMLTEDLARAARITLKKPHRRRMVRLQRLSMKLPRLAVPPLQMPKIQVPSITVPLPRWPRRTEQSKEPVAAPPMIVATAAATTVDAPVATELAPLGFGAAALADIPALAVPDMTLHDIPAAETSDLPEQVSPTASEPDGHDTVDPWTAEDRALAVAAALADIWATSGISSPIVALDTPSAPGSGQVLVTIEERPGEERLISDLPDRLVERQPAWRACWRRDLLEVFVSTDRARPPTGGPLLVPLLRHGRGGRKTRFFPLSSWRHLGLYGGQALGALHALLGSTLFTQPPAAVAVTILDHGEIAPLYRNVAHRVPPPGGAVATLELLMGAIRQGAREDVRPLLLVVVEPDDAALYALRGILTRLQARPAAPVHLIIAQEQPRPAGRELYAMLPALVTCGTGQASLLPGQGTWPKPGQARLVGRGVRIEGRAIQMDEAAIAAHVAQLRGSPSDLPPVIWEQPATMASAASAPAAIPLPNPLHATVGSTGEPVADGLGSATEGGATISDVDANGRRRQIIALIVAERQRHADTANAPMETSAVRLLDAHPPHACELALDAKSDSPHTDTELSSHTISQTVDEPIPPDTLCTARAPQDQDDIVDAPEPARDGPLPDPAADVAASVAPPAVLDAISTVDGAHDGWLAELVMQNTRPRREQLARRGTAPLAATHSDAAQSGQGHAPLAVTEVEPDNGWPPGPAPLGRVALAELFTRIITTPSMTAGSNPAQIGLTQNRLVDLLKGQYVQAPLKDLARTLLVWFELAGLLADAPPATRWRTPRPLTTSELPTIAVRLSATPIPDSHTVRAAWNANT